MTRTWRGSDWWTRCWAIALAMLGATIPLWFVQVPPLIDLLGHIGRYHIQLDLADNPLLQRNWGFHWRLIGNLGADLLIEPLGRLFGVERGAAIIAAMIPALMIWGMTRLSRAAHGQIEPSAWATFPLAMAYPWHYGLINYWFGIALALHGAASAYRLPQARLVRYAWLAVVSLLLWTVHIYGWAVFALLVGTRALAGGPWQNAARRLLALWPVALPAALMLALSYGARGSAETYRWFLFGAKLEALYFSLRDQWQWLDVGTLGLMLFFLFAALRSPRFRHDRALALAAVALIVAVAIIPYELFGSAFADGRLAPVVVVVALLAVGGPAPAYPRGANAIALLAAAVFAVRLSVTAAAFQAYDAAYARHLQALDHVARGSRVAVLLNFPCETPGWRRERIDHLDGIAIARRDVFTNGQWNVPGAQTLMPLGGLGTPYNADPSELVRLRTCPKDLLPELARKLAAVPHGRFDYVWVLGWPPAVVRAPAGLKPLFADETTVLYGVKK